MAPVRMLRRTSKRVRCTSTMSELVKRHILCIQALNRYKNNKLRRAILANADADLICALAECSYNILKGPTQRKRLKKYRKELLELAKRRLPIARRRHILQEQTGGFLSALLAPLAGSVILPLLRQVLA